MNSKGEIWKAIPEYEGLYEVSNFGRVRSLPRNTTSGRELKQYVSTQNGYCYVSLHKNSGKKTKRVHVLVMHAFSPIDKKYGYDKNYTIDHIDGDKTNNSFSNLEWCSQSENTMRAWKAGLIRKAAKSVIDLDTMEVFESALDASRSVGGKRAAQISRVCLGQRSQYRDHRFAYYEDYLNGKIPDYKGRVKKRSVQSLWVM